MKNNLLLSDKIKNQIVEYIAKGIYEQDTLLPSVRSYALSLGINPNTVQKAYQKLEEEGHIVSVEKKGSYVKDVAYSKQVYIHQKIEAFYSNVVSMYEANVDKQQLQDVIDKIYKGE